LFILQNFFCDSSKGITIFVAILLFLTNRVGRLISMEQGCLATNQFSMDLLYILIIGAVAGWLAGLIWKGGGFGLLWNIILGIAGSFVGGWLLGKLGVNVSIGSHVVNLIVTSVIGAIVVLFIASLVKRR
jgi:uncharacterized membrane protein YeaQ/YmgE (transglycosylase-associated protein family)